MGRTRSDVLEHYWPGEPSTNPRYFLLDVLVMAPPCYRKPARSTHWTIGSNPVDADTVNNQLQNPYLEKCNMTLSYGTTFCGVLAACSSCPNVHTTSCILIINPTEHQFHEATELDPPSLSNRLTTNLSTFHPSQYSTHIKPSATTKLQPGKAPPKYGSSVTNNQP
jgi:hypothetical protein